MKPFQAITVVLILTVISIATFSYYQQTQINGLSKQLDAANPILGSMQIYTQTYNFSITGAVIKWTATENGSIVNEYETINIADISLSPCNDTKLVPLLSYESYGLPISKNLDFGRYNFNITYMGTTDSWRNYFNYTMNWSTNWTGGGGLTHGTQLLSYNGTMFICQGILQIANPNYTDNSTFYIIDSNGTKWFELPFSLRSNETIFNGHGGLTGIPWLN